MSTLMVEPLRPALAVSVLVHAAVLGLAVLLTVRPVQPASPVDGGASLSGDTFDVDELLETQKSRAPAAAAPPAAAEPAAGSDDAPPAPAEPVVRKKPIERRPAAEPKKKPEPSAGESGEAPSAKPAAPAAAASAASAAAGGGETGDPSAGTTGTDPGVANLAKAFAKAVTAATHKDPTWDELPLGPAGTVRVAIHVDEEGHIERSLVAEREETPAHLVRLVDRTLLLLRAGRFALSKSEAKAGTETLRIEVTLSSVDAQEDYEDPRHTVAMGFEPPRPTQPGRAYFVHAAGRRFEAKISIE